MKQNRRKHSPSFKAFHTCVHGANPTGGTCSLEVETAVYSLLRHRSKARLGMMASVAFLATLQTNSCIVHFFSRMTEVPHIY